MTSKPNTSGRTPTGHGFRALQRAAGELDLLEEERCGRFSRWVDAELERLVAAQSAFITPSSLRKSLR